MPSACASCAADPPIRASVLPNCDHVFCEVCAADALARAPKCPECGKAAASVKPAWALRRQSPDGATLITVRHCGVSFVLHLQPDGRLYPACSSVWLGLRLKLILKGKLLRPYATATDGMVLQLVTSKAEARGALPPWLRMRAEEYLEGAREVLTHSWAAVPPRGQLRAGIVGWLWAFGRGFFLFFLSMVAPPESPAPREGPR